MTNRMMHKDLYQHLNLEELKREKEFLFSELDDFRGRLTKFDKEKWESERDKNISSNKSEQDLLLEDVFLLRKERENRIKSITDYCLKAMEDGILKVEVVKEV